MAGFHREVIILRPREAVFDFACNLANASKFMPTVVKCEWVTEGGMRSGAKFRETRMMNGKERSAVIEVVEHRRPDVHAARSAMMGMHATFTFRFESVPEGTRVTLDAVVGGNLLWKLFLGSMSRMMEKEDGAFLDRLKSAMP